MDTIPEEAFFINVYRFFEFLRLKGYSGKEFSLSSRVMKYVSFYNTVNSKTVSIIQKESGSLDFFNKQKRFLE